MKITNAVRIVLLLIVSVASAKSDTRDKWAVSAFAEMYYSYDFSNPQNHEKPNFIYNYKRHNELSLNMLVVKGNYTDSNVRATFGVMAGTYPQYNLSSEPAWAQYIHEANVGIKLFDEYNLWVDVGVLPSHIGFENTNAFDCWTLTRSILAEQSPYFESGVKLGYETQDNSLFVSILALNGWQRITKPDFIQQPSFGMQITYKPAERILLNYSNFIGTAKPDSLSSRRFFHNVYLQYTPSRQTGIIVGFDVGSDNNSQGTNALWYSPVIILRQSINEKIRASLRVEYYNDYAQIIIPTITNNGFETLGTSVNIDFDVASIVLLRCEGKILRSKDAIFLNNSHTNYSLTSSMSVRL